MTSPTGTRGIGKFFLVKGQNKLEEVSSYQEPIFQKPETPYPAADADGKRLYGYNSKTGEVGCFDGKQFTVINGSDLNDALLEYIVSIGIDRFDVYNGFQTMLVPSQAPAVENGVIYTFAMVNPPDDFNDDDPEDGGEDASDETDESDDNVDPILSGTTGRYVCSFDLNDKNPHWSFKSIDDFPNDFLLNDFKSLSCFYSG